MILIFNNKIDVLLINIFKHIKYDGNDHFVISNFHRYCVIKNEKETEHAYYDKKIEGHKQYGLCSIALPFQFVPKISII